MNKPAYEINDQNAIGLNGKPYGWTETDAAELRELAFSFRRDDLMEDGRGFVTGAGTWVGATPRFPTLASALKEIRARGILVRVAGEA